MPGIPLFVAIAYVGLLFAVAFLGDRVARNGPGGARPWRYALALSVYCTSWTFYGSVGLATRSGFAFLAIYVGPILVFTLGHSFLQRIARIAEAERITSVADFLSARYGKSQGVAVAATLIAVIGAIPYIALQLKAVALSLDVLAPDLPSAGFGPFGDTAFLTALVLAVFAILFGTRHADATEHQDGMVLAVSVEAVVKLFAFLLVGGFVTFALMGGPMALLARAAADPHVAATYSRLPDAGLFLAMTVLATVCTVLLDRQFHMTFVEMHDRSELRRARWLFPLYLVAINVFVVPIAIAGSLLLPPGVDPDLYVLELPHRAGASVVTLAAFLGGLSAATAMVIVASVALSIMISNAIVVPALVRRRSPPGRQREMTRLILLVRRLAIVAVLALASVYERLPGPTALASIGLLSFAAIGQLAPAFFGGLMWRRANARGALAGMSIGFVAWAYLLLLPSTSGVLAGVVDHGPFGIEALRPAAFLAVSDSAFANGVFWSLFLNTLGVVAGSLSRRPTAIERHQAAVFVPSAEPPPADIAGRAARVEVGELRETVGRYLGTERAERAIARFAAEHDIRLDAHLPVDPELLRHAEQLLASAVGAASARLILSLLVSRGDPATRAASRLLDDAADALRYNRALLQSALDQVDQGIAVFDESLRLASWNRPFRRHLALAPDYGQFGTPLRDILIALAREGLFGDGAPEGLADRRLVGYVEGLEATRDRHPRTGRVLALLPARLEREGIAFTVTDVTAEVDAALALSRANAGLERRVAERTAELVRLNAALEEARAAAEAANLGKTRFIAAAGHDILQPLNAARLYATALAERTGDGPHAALAGDLGVALDAAEEIFQAVLDLSRLDAGQWRPEIATVPLDALFERTRAEFEPIAAATGRTLRLVGCRAVVRTDGPLLARVLRNLVSNALKYNRPGGKVLVGCRRRGAKLAIEVLDNGLGIAPADRTLIFEEFRRLDDGARAAPGLGLGLSIVERVGRVLGLRVDVASEAGRGSRFSVAGLETVETSAAVAAVAALPLAVSRVAGLTALVVDNDPRIRDGMVALLSGWGCRAVAGGTAAEGLAALGQAGLAPDILLVDFHLDAADGLSAIGDLRVIFGGDLPAVLITADRSKDVRERARALGVDVLHKPLKPAQLRALMSRAPPQRLAAE